MIVSAFCVGLYLGMLAGLIVGACLAWPAGYRHARHQRAKGMHAAPRKVPR